MVVLSTTITRIEAERKGVAPRVKVNLTPTIKEVEKSKLEGLGKKPQDILNIKFLFETKFNPEVGILRMEGNLLYMDENVDSIYKEWQKNKKLPEDVNAEIINSIFRSMVPKALFLSTELQLPPIVPIPRVIPKAHQEQKKE